MFKPGQSGNPMGRKPGTQTARTQYWHLLDPKAPELVDKCVQMALDGNEACMRLVIERLIPKMKYRDEEIEMKVESLLERLLDKL